MEGRHMCVMFLEDTIRQLNHFAGQNTIAFTFKAGNHLSRQLFSKQSGLSKIKEFCMGNYHAGCGKNCDQRMRIKSPLWKSFHLHQ